MYFIDSYDKKNNKQFLSSKKLSIDDRINTKMTETVIAHIIKYSC